MKPKEIFAEAAAWEKVPYGLKRADWTKRTVKHFADAWKRADVREVLIQEGRLLGFFLHYRRVPAMVKGQHSVMFRINPRARKAGAEWLTRKLRENRGKFRALTEAGVAHGERELLKAFRDFKLHSTILEGEVGPSLRRLVRAKNPVRELPGFEIRPIRPREVEVLMRLQKKIFTRIPDRGYYSHIPSRMKSDRKEYLAAARNPRLGVIYGTWKGQRLLGAFSFFPHANGQRAGTSLMFDFPIQGKGFAKTAYRLLLEEMKRRGVKRYYGGTSQPAVLGLAKIMGRKPRSYLLRFNARLLPRRT